MAFHGLRRGNIPVHGWNGETLQGTNGQDQLGLRWAHLLFPVDAGDPTPPVAAGDAPPIASASASIAIDTVTGHGAPTSPVEDSASFWHPPYFAAELHFDATDGLPPIAADVAPPAGHIPKAEAVIWSGPAIMAFPGDAHETGDASNATPPNVTAGDSSPPEVAGGDATPPDVAGLPDAVTRADLDPVLAAMGSGTDHADHGLFDPPGDSSSGDLGAAFLPADGSDLVPPPHGLDPGFTFTHPPLPPPPPEFG